MNIENISDKRVIRMLERESELSHEYLTSVLDYDSATGIFRVS